MSCILDFSFTGILCMPFSYSASQFAPARLMCSVAPVANGRLWVVPYYEIETACLSGTLAHNCNPVSRKAGAEEFLASRPTWTTEWDLVFKKKNRSVIQCGEPLTTVLVEYYGIIYIYILLAAASWLSLGQFPWSVSPFITMLLFE